MMEVLQERGLTLSRKKTYIGSTNTSFHFLGIQYPGTRTLDNTIKPRSDDNTVEDYYKSDLFLKGKNESDTNLADCQPNISSSIFPHARSLRKARLQVSIMVVDGFSNHQIKNYLHRWAQWCIWTHPVCKGFFLWQKRLSACVYPALLNISSGP